MCTANRVRSPMAEAFLRRRLQVAGVDADVSSCGFLDAGIPATPEAEETMSGFGLDLSTHRSRRLTPQLLDESDLVVTMGREHLRSVVVTYPDGFARTFTLKELLRRGEAAGPRRSGEALADYLARLAGERQRADLLGGPHEIDDDVADPIGQPAAAYLATAAELDELTRRVADLLVGT